MHDLHCFQWAPEVLYPWVAGNLAVAACYAVIPALLMLMYLRRPDILPAWAAGSFAAFIAACGLGHVVKVVTLWHPIYQAAAWLDVATALVSVPAALGLCAAIRNVGQLAGLVMWQHIDAALHALPVAVFLVARNGTIRWAAGRALLDADYDAAAVMGQRVQEVIPHATRVLEGYERAFNGEASQIIHGDGGRSYLTRFRPVSGAGWVSAVAATIDLTSVAALPTGLPSALERLRTGAPDG